MSNPRILKKGTHPLVVLYEYIPTKQIKSGVGGVVAIALASYSPRYGFADLYAPDLAYGFLAGVGVSLIYDGAAHIFSQLSKHRVRVSNGVGGRPEVYKVAPPKKNKVTSIRRSGS